MTAAARPLADGVVGAVPVPAARTERPPRPRRLPPPRVEIRDETDTDWTPPAQRVHPKTLRVVMPVREHEPVLHELTIELSQWSLAAPDLVHVSASNALPHGAGAGVTYQEPRHESAYEIIGRCLIDGAVVPVAMLERLIEGLQLALRTMRDAGLVPSTAAEEGR